MQLREVADKRTKEWFEQLPMWQALQCMQHAVIRQKQYKHPKIFVDCEENVGINKEIWIQVAFDDCNFALKTCHNS